MNEDNPDIDLCHGPQPRGDYDEQIVEGEFADEYALGEESEADGYFDDV